MSGSLTKSFISRTIRKVTVPLSYIHLLKVILFVWVRWQNVLFWSTLHVLLSEQWAGFTMLIPWIPFGLYDPLCSENYQPVSKSLICFDSMHHLHFWNYEQCSLKCFSGNGFCLFAWFGMNSEILVILWSYNLDVILPAVKVKGSSHLFTVPHSIHKWPRTDLINPLQFVFLKPTSTCNGAGLCLVELPPYGYYPLGFPSPSCRTTPLCQNWFTLKLVKV